MRFTYQISREQIVWKMEIHGMEKEVERMGIRKAKDGKWVSGEGRGNRFRLPSVSFIVLKPPCRSDSLANTATSG